MPTKTTRIHDCTRPISRSVNEPKTMFEKKFHLLAAVYGLTVFNILVHNLW